MANEIKYQVTATIDDLNQYLNGYVTDEGLSDTLKELLKLIEHKVNTTNKDNITELNN